MDEDLLDARGSSPLLRVVRTVRDLFQGKTTIVDVFEDEDAVKHHDSDPESRRQGLTAAIAYLHSRGMSYPRKSVSASLIISRY